LGPAEAKFGRACVGWFLVTRVGRVGGVPRFGGRTSHDDKKEGESLEAGMAENSAIRLYQFRSPLAPANAFPIAQSGIHPSRAPPHAWTTAGHVHGSACAFADTRYIWIPGFSGQVNIGVITQRINCQRLFPQTM
jgi:hypothetical protein